MPDDLLARIAVEIDERLQSLWPAMQEFERLEADLRALEGEMEVADETIDTALAAPVADGASEAGVGPIADIAPAVDVAVPVAEVAALAPGVTAVAEVAIPVPDVAAAEAAPVAEVAAPVLGVVVAEVAAPIAEDTPAAELAPSQPTCEAPRPRPLLSPKVLRLMDSPGRGPLRGRGAGGARRRSASFTDGPRVR